MSGENVTGPWAAAGGVRCETAGARVDVIFKKNNTGRKEAEQETSANGEDVGGLGGSRGNLHPSQPEDHLGTFVSIAEGHIWWM